MVKKSNVRTAANGLGYEDIPCFTTYDSKIQGGADLFKSVLNYENLSCRGGIRELKSILEADCYLPKRKYTTKTGYGGCYAAFWQGGRLDIGYKTSFRQLKKR